MKIKTKEKISYFFYILSGLFLLSLIILLITEKKYDYKGEIEPIYILGNTSLFCICSYIANRFYAKSKNTKKIMYWNFIVYFIIYIVLVFTFTGRNLSFTIHFDSISFNLIPLKEIITTIKSRELTHLALLAGNFLLLTPLTFFLPRMSKKTNSIFPFSVCAIVFAIAIESIQSLFGVGIFDIDDIVLNAGGAIVFFPICNRSFLSPLLDNLFLLKENPIQKKSIYKSIFFLIGIVIALVGCIYYYWYKTPGVEIDWQIDSNTCEIGKTLLYEDVLNKYYYPCSTTDNVYIVFDKKKKFKVTDLIEKKVKTKYSDYISTGLISSIPGVEIESKYSTIEVSSTSIDTNIRAHVEIEDIISLIDGKSSSSSTGRTLSYMLYPLKEGTTNLSFEFYDIQTGESIKTITYLVEVDENKKVTYKEK